MKRFQFLALLLASSLLLAYGAAQVEAPKRTPSPAGAKVYIVSPTNGATVPKNFKVIFGLTGMGISPAGITVEGAPIPNTGHHHLLVDVVALSSMAEPVPSTNTVQIMHFGKGQTETMLDLPPGRHTLQLVFADHAHVPHDPPVVSEKITITVQP